MLNLGNFISEFIVAAVYLYVVFIRSGNVPWDRQVDGADPNHTTAPPWQRPLATHKAVRLASRAAQCQVQEASAGSE